MTAATYTRSFREMDCATGSIPTVSAPPCLTEKQEFEARLARDVRRLVTWLGAIFRHKGAKDETLDLIDSYAEFALARLLRSCSGPPSGSVCTDDDDLHFVAEATELIVQVGIMGGLSYLGIKKGFEDVLRVDFLSRKRQEEDPDRFEAPISNYDPLWSPWVAAVFRAVYARHGVDCDSRDYDNEEYAYCLMSTAGELGGW
jgi:hypothetical protein